MPRCSAVLFLIALACFAQDARVSVTPRLATKRHLAAAAAIRVETKLVLIPVTVTDPFGAPFRGLARDVFRLFEDGVEQQVKYFTAEDAPVSLGLVFDASRSMEGKLDDSREAVSRFLRSSMTGDEFFLVEFNDAPRLISGFTNDAERIEKALVGITPRNWTALLDAVYVAVHQMKRAKNARKALLILSDGGDNNSRYTESETKAMVREADVCIYSIGLGTGILKRHTRLLRELSQETGGQLYQVDKMADLPEAARKVSAAIRQQYVLGYSSKKMDNDGLYRKIQVRLNPPAELPPLHATWRTGYYAPGE